MLLMGFSRTTTSAGFGFLAGFASFAGALAFATGFFLAGVFIATTYPAPRLNVNQPKKVRHS